MEQGDPDVSEYGEVADLEYGTGLDQPPTTIIIKELFQKRLLYHMSPGEVNFQCTRTIPSITGLAFLHFLTIPAPWLFGLSQDTILASMLLRPGPVRALKGARFEGGKDDDSVPRIYIKTLHDQMLEPMKQEQMIKRWQPCQVLVLDSDHSPFFSTPSLLLDLKEQQLPSSIVTGNYVSYTWCIV